MKLIVNIPPKSHAEITCAVGQQPPQNTVSLDGNYFEVNSIGVLTVTSNDGTVAAFAPGKWDSVQKVT